MFGLFDYGITPKLVPDAEILTLEEAIAERERRSLLADPLIEECCSNPDPTAQNFVQVCYPCPIHSLNDVPLSPGIQVPESGAVLKVPEQAALELSLAQKSQVNIPKPVILGAGALALWMLLGG